MEEKTPQAKHGSQRLKKIAIELFILIVLFNLISLFLSRDMLKGDMPLVKTTDIQGQMFDNRKLEGKSYLLYFWGSWCPICSITQSNIQFLSSHWPVFSIAMSSGENAEVADYLQQNHLDFVTINDEYGDWAKQFNVIGVPAIFIVNPQGKIVFSEKGYSSTFGLWLKLLYAQHLS